MQTFSEFQNQKQSSYSVYLEAIQLHSDPQLNEFISSISGKLKKYYNFIKDLAQSAKVGVAEIVSLLSNRKIFEFFQKIKFSVKLIFEKVKLGFKYYRDLKSVIYEYISSTKVVKWTEEKLKLLDEFLAKHPKTRRIAGIAVGCILLYIWLNMSFTGDFDYDFDQSVLIGAVMGTFSLSEIFTGPEGVKLISLFITGTIFSFPWPGPQTVLFTVSMLYGLSKMVNMRDIGVKLRNSLRN